MNEAVSTFSTSSHCSLSFPKKGLAVAFHKLTEVQSTDAA